MRQLLAMALGILLVACGSSGKDEVENGNGNGSGIEMLPGCENSVCTGSYVRKCAEDQKSYVYEYCYLRACKNGSCVDPGCTDPGAATCDAGQVSICSQDLSMMYKEDCDAGTKCIGGICAVETCKAGEKKCGWRSSLECGQDGTWAAIACGDDQYCDPTSFGCADTDPFCLENPLAVKCVALDTAMECNYTGQTLLAKCTAGQVCVEGFCQPRVKGVEYKFEEEGGSTEAGPENPSEEDVFVPPDEDVTIIDLGKMEAPPLEVPPKAWVTINGGDWDNEQVKFVSSKSANYVFKDKDLQVSMAKGQLMMEVHFMGIDENVVGAWSSDEPGAVQVLIVFNDGTTDQTVVQWKYYSVAYAVTLDLFEAPGGRVEGTFSGTLEQDPNAGPGPNLELVEGYFNVPRKE